jgi:hypothetical protein
MPVIGEVNEAKASTRAIKDIAERLGKLVEAKAEESINAWLFTVHRDDEDSFQP